jgi:hypothetical protein
MFIKEKLQRTNASIWFNKVCKAEQLQPQYINVKVNGTSKRSHDTKKSGHQVQNQRRIEISLQEEN